MGAWPTWRGVGHLGGELSLTCTLGGAMHAGLVAPPLGQVLVRRELSWAPGPCPGDSAVPSVLCLHSFKIFTLKAERLLPTPNYRRYFVPFGCVNSDILCCNVLASIR